MSTSRLFSNLVLLCSVVVHFSFAHLWVEWVLKALLLSFSFNLFLHQKLPYWLLQWFLLGVEVLVFVSRVGGGGDISLGAIFPLPLLQFVWSKSCLLWPLIISPSAAWFLKFLSSELTCPFYCPLGQNSIQGGLVHSLFWEHTVSMLGMNVTRHRLLLWKWPSLPCQNGLLTTGSGFPTFQDVSDTSPSHFREYISGFPGVLRNWTKNILLQRKYYSWLFSCWINTLPYFI